VGFIADQDAGRKGAFVDFFGRKASTYKIIALMAMQYEVPVVIGYGKRLDEDDHFEIGIERIILPHEWAGKDDPVLWITQEYTAALEQVIRRAPEQYLWVHRRWKHRVVELAAAKPGDRALDLCCGTGDIAFALAQCGAEVTGLDFSQAMLDIAEKRRQKNLKSQIPNPKFIQGDAQQIPFPDNSFDIVTVGYGLRNLTNWEAGLAEMRRVAKPGGRLAVLDFGKPANAAWRTVYFTHLKFFVPLLGWIFCGNAQAYAYILESLKRFPAQTSVAAKMRELKLTNVRVINLVGGAMAINYGEKPL
jgi:demethylmenaquinone methyltransferase/2-methoxy-6-polyprenyl-1,4-benzoquinol methylase